MNKRKKNHLGFILWCQSLIWLPSNGKSLITMTTTSAVIIPTPSMLPRAKAEGRMSKTEVLRLLMVDNSSFFNRSSCLILTIFCATEVSLLRRGTLSHGHKQPIKQYLWYLNHRWEGVGVATVRRRLSHLKFLEKSCRDWCNFKNLASTLFFGIEQTK